jgi:hypothetical protein
VIKRRLRVVEGKGGVHARRGIEFSKELSCNLFKIVSRLNPIESLRHHHTTSRGARSSRQDCDLTQLPSELKHTEHRDDKAQTQIYPHHSNGVTSIVVARTIIEKSCLTGFIDLSRREAVKGLC